MEVDAMKIDYVCDSCVARDKRLESVLANQDELAKLIKKVEFREFEDSKLYVLRVTVSKPLSKIQELDMMRYIKFKGQISIVTEK